MYTADGKHWSVGFEYFVKSGIEQELVMLNIQMIPHLKALDVSTKISQEQLTLC